MTEPNPRCYKMSASSISCFKACPMRFRLSYREGLRPDTDTEAQRVGTNWHGIHEVYRNHINLFSSHFFANDKKGFEIAYTRHKADALNAVVEHLAQAYEKVPSWSDPVSWDLERKILETCFVAYLWYYSNDTMEYLAQEICFDLGVRVPSVGMNLPLAEAVRVGKIDHLINWEGMVGVLERKSTTRNIDLSGDYWDKSRKDTQVSMYSLAVQDLFDQGKLPLDGVEYQRLGNTLYDVWRRPTIKPKKLTQKDTAAFIEDGGYYGQRFEVVTRTELQGEEGEAVVEVPVVWVDGVRAEVEIGKKANAIRETIPMYCARLMELICEDPTKYFQRKEIVRTQKELDKFRAELYSLYTMQKFCEKNDSWYENENQCRATFACQYIPICYGAGADAVCDGKTTPHGFKRIFVDLTKEGQQVEEGE